MRDKALSQYSPSHSPRAPVTAPQKRLALRRDVVAIRIWLAILCAAIVTILIVGGITRLTDSGLSITQWRPISGALPPLSHEQWQAEFARYQEIPQFHLVNASMTLAEFKYIYFWEWLHRNLARSLGLIFLLPLILFSLRRSVAPWLAGLLWGSFIVGVLGQGLIGWWMVSSGLRDQANELTRTSVAPMRLMIHLFLPLTLLALLFGLIRLTREAGSAQARGFRTGDLVMLGALFAQILLGALVAGNDAGRIFTDWPLMGGQFVPAGYWDLHPLWRNLVENRAPVQFNHRLVGYGVFILAWWLALRTPRAHELRSARLGLAMILTGQLILGIATVLHAAPLSLALPHQILAVICLLWAVSNVVGSAHLQSSSSRAN